MATKDKSNFSLNLQITPQQLRCFLDLGACLPSFSISATHFLHAQTNHRNVQKKWCQPVYFKRTKRYLCSQQRSHFSSCVIAVRSVFPWKQGPLASRTAQPGWWHPAPRNSPGEPALPVSVESVTVITKLGYGQ